MSKLKHLMILTAVSSALILAACGNKDTATTSNPDTKATEQVTQVNNYIQNFNPTESFINRYVQPDFDFNSTLPLKGKFVNTLNDISNGSRVYNDANPEAKDHILNEVLLTINERFKAYADFYKSDNEAFKKDFGDAANNFNLDTVDLKDAIDQLNTGCINNNNYQANLDEIKKLQPVDEAARTQPFPQEIIDEVNTWNDNFKATCEFTAHLYKVVSSPNFSWSALQASTQAATANAASAEKPAEQPADKPTEQSAPADKPAEAPTK